MLRRSTPKTLHICKVTVRSLPCGGWVRAQKRPNSREQISHLFVITCCSQIKNAIVVQFVVQFGCSSLKSRAGRAGEQLASPCGTVPSPAPPGAVSPCKKHSFFCTYFIWTVRWAKLSHTRLQQQNTLKKPPLNRQIYHQIEIIYRLLVVMFITNTIIFRGHFLFTILSPTGALDHEF